MTSTNHEKMIAFIDRCDDADKLKRLITNAARLEDRFLERAAMIKLYAILPSQEPGSLEHDVWQSIYALEGALKSERGKTVLLGRTRQKITRDGEIKTVEDLVQGKTSDGFDMLIDRDMESHTFEAVALRHPDKFSVKTLEAAKTRLAAVPRDHA